jgi:CHAT domain-containing protein
LGIILELGERAENLPNCYYNLALNYLYLNRFKEALEMAGKGQEYGRKLGQPVMLANSEYLAGIAHFSLGHFTTALRTWDNALLLFQNNECPQQAYWVDSDRCTCLVQLNRLEEALELCEKQVKEGRSHGWTRDLAQMLFWRGRIKARLDPDDDEALNDYSEAAELFKTLGLHNWQARLYLDQAELLLSREEYAGARQILKLVETEFEGQDMPRWLAHARLVQARIELAEGDFELAEVLGYKALHLAKNYDLAELNYQGWQLLGEVAEEKCEYAQALGFYREAAAQIERLRGAVTLELRGDFLKDKMRSYEGVVHLSLTQGDIEQAYDYIERSKSRALTEMLANQVDLQVRARSEADAILIEDLQRLRQEHAQYFSLLNQSAELASGQLRGKAPVLELEASQVSQDLKRCEKKIEEILLTLQIRNSAYAEDFSLTEVSSESPQPWLATGSLIVEYYINGQEVLALAISANEKRVYRHLITLDKLEDTLKRLSIVLQGMPPQFAAKFLVNTQAHLAALYRSLFEPMAAWAKNFRQLIFVPHGPLHHLPFHALWHRETGRYLLEDYEVSYLPAASQLKFYHQRAAELRQNNGTNQSLVMAYSGQGSLPFVVQEANEVAGILGERPYLEAAARRSILEELAGAYKIIHLATHGQFRADAPLFSFVELADGTLLTADLFNLRLRASLVTLSACESGLNKITGGNELVGLSRACLYAGAASLLLSLWRVEDRSTACLMKDFYRRLLEIGKTKAAALREAQLALLRGELHPEWADDYRHPYYWAAFCLIGENGEL